MNTRPFWYGLAGGIVFQIGLAAALSPQAAFFIAITVLLAIAIGFSEKERR